MNSIIGANVGYLRGAAQQRERIWKSCAAGLIACLLIAPLSKANAQGSAVGVKHKFDWSERLEPNLALQRYDENLLGDEIDLQSGALTFHQVDVSLPGNSDLEVAVRRSRDNRRQGVYGGFKD